MEDEDIVYSAWKSYRRGAIVNNGELKALNVAVNKTISDLKMFGEPQYQLVLDDLVRELNVLNRWMENRKMG